MRKQQITSQGQTREQLREHYEVEKELANRLRRASKEERRYLYSSLHDELYRRVPHHPLLTRKKSSVERARAVDYQMTFLKPFLSGDFTFIEIGPGDCALSYEVVKHVKQVWAVDVSDEITRSSTAPGNFQLILSDGSSIPVPRSSANVAYSNQLMEHLHPADAFEQLRNIYDALTPGGIYICITPNKLTGPHDVSKYFDVTATGFHLKEYTISELNALFKKVGFSKVRAYVGARGFYKRSPVAPLTWCEWLLGKLPVIGRRAIVHGLRFRIFLNVRLLAVK